MSVIRRPERKVLLTQIIAKLYQMVLLLHGITITIGWSVVMGNQ